MRAVVLSAFALTGCVGMTTLNGARTLQPGESTVQVGGANNLVSMQTRRGLAPDVDVGLTLRNQAVGADLRLRFFRSERLHLATAPGLAVVTGAVFFGEGGFGLRAAGHVDLTLPLLAEAELTRTVSVVLAPRVVVSNRFALADADGEFYNGDASWSSVVLGAGTRVDWHPGRIALGLTFDVQHASTAAQNLTPFVGLDLTVRQPRLSARLSRSVRRQSKGKTP